MNNEILIFVVPLDQPPERVAASAAVLSRDECERAARFRDPVHGSRFAFCRSTLRHILSRVLDRRPDQLTFQYTPFGKPELADVRSHGLHFNVTHSADLAMIGLRREVEIGIDVERFRPDFATDEIAERFFASGERMQLSALPASERTAGFFRCWCRKEAFIKAVGEGLSYPLDEFEVSIGATAELRSIRGDSGAARNWLLANLPCPSGFAAALASPRPVARIVIDPWSPTGTAQPANLAIDISAIE